LKAAPKPWTTKEDEIIRTVRCGRDAFKKLPGRTYHAVKSRRRQLGVRVADRWTRREDNKLIKYRHEPLREQARRFRCRTSRAIRARRRQLGISASIKRPWFGSEVKQLGSLYPRAGRSELLASLPRHTLRSIEKKARSLGYLRQIALLFSEQDSLHQQVRQRAKEDGIALRKLGKETDCGSYYCSRFAKREDYEKIARAVEFFGGRLVIDWQDE